MSTIESPNIADAAGRRDRPFPRWAKLLILFAIAMCGMYWAVRSADSKLLLPARGASWIRRNEPFDLKIRANSVAVSRFATDFSVRAPISSAVLRVAAMGQFFVKVDGAPRFEASSETRNWRTECQVPFGNMLPGTHRLEIDVFNRDGPEVIRADCSDLEIQTGNDWQASVDRQGWAPVALVDRSWELPLAQQFEPVAESVTRYAPLLALFFVLGAMGHYFGSARVRFAAFPWARTIRWCVLAAWAVLAVNNIFKLPAGLGYDVKLHLDYVTYVAEHWRVPLPNQGFEMYHPPLYYFCSAALLKLLILLGCDPARALLLLRIVPLSCGLVMVELCYRAGRIVWPAAQFPQVVGTVIGGLVPMNLYMGQAVSNEPLAACLGGLLAVICLALLADRWPMKKSRLVHLSLWVGLGLLLGVGGLTKLSGLVWAGPLIVVATLTTAREQGTIAGRAAAAAISVFSICLSAGLVIGWYFLRNYHALGVPFYTHSTLAGLRWWQDPGYRTVPQFFSFGRSLVTPVFGNLNSFWDNVYGTLWADSMLNDANSFNFKPPWNYGWIGCGIWLAVPLTIALMVGFVTAVRSNRSAEKTIRQRSGIRFAAFTLGLFLLALIYVWLSWPVYSAVKSSYLLSVTPCMAILVAAGIECLSFIRWMRSAWAGLLLCWALTCYLSYFIW